MNSGNSFIKTLKRLGYHEADTLDDSDFNSITSEKELKSFFEVFCTLNEKNVLTAEEIEEYSALTPAELAEIEILKKNGKLEKNDIEYEKTKDILFLQEQLAYIENHNRSIERQIEMFKKYEKDLLEEKEIQQSLLLNAKKKFQTYERSQIPQAEEEFFSSLTSILEVAQDLEFLIAHSDTNDFKLPTSNFFKDLVHQYLHAEEKLHQCVVTYLENNFQLQEDGTFSFIVDENLHRKEFTKETSFLQKMLKSNITDKVISEKEVIKIKEMVKYTEAVETSDLNPSQLKYKLDDALKINEQLKKKEEELQAFIDNAVCKHVDALLTEVDLCVNSKALDNFKFFTEKISLPMTTLIHQRARLEMLISLLGEHKEELQNLKKLIEVVLNQLKQEQSYLEQRKILIENQMNHTSQKKNDLCVEPMIFSSLCRILGNVESLDDSKASINDVIDKANKFSEAKENLKKKYEEKIGTIDYIEEYAHSVESLLNCTDNEYCNWHELEQTMNSDLNNLDVKLKSLVHSTAECSRDLEQKQMLLERRGNLHLARNLYVYALMNKELFKKCIDDINVAIENSTDQ